MASFTEIKVPYAFSPVSSWVFSPDWQDEVYHDVPFRDGLSGRIDYELENSSPLCVGHDTVLKKDADGDDIKTLLWEHDGTGRQVIPGSSIKGMLRTAIEIAAFGKMECVRDLKHAIRLEIGEVKGANSDCNYNLLPVFIRPDSRHPGNWQYLETVATPGNKPVSASVNAENLARIFRMDRSLSGQVKTMSAHDKHQALMKALGLKISDRMPLLYASLNRGHGFSPKQKNKNDPASRIETFWQEVESVSLVRDDKHKYPGMFLFMSENIANKSKMKANLFTDYFFYLNDEDPAANEGRWRLLDNDLVRDLNASLPPMKADETGAHDSKEENLFDYNLSRMHPEYGFPVWYLEHRRDPKKSALGFCQVMRKVRDKSVLDMISDAQGKLSGIRDLADVMFGYISGDDASGSRIGFSDLLADRKYDTETHTYVLGEPKSSFSPVYLGKFDFKQEYNEGSVIAGRKLYKIRKDFKMAAPQYPNDNKKVRSAAEFVVPGSVFRGSVVFHNLKPEELGALLWVMTFGQGVNAAASPYFHSLGHARPMGAGAVKLKLNQDCITIPSYLMTDGKVLPGNLDCRKEDLLQICMDRFERLMNIEYPFRKTGHYHEWSKSIIIQNYLKTARMDEKCLENEVYNKFPDDFTEIRRDYRNTPNAKDHPGYGTGRQKGPACDVCAAEKYRLSKTAIDEEIAELKKKEAEEKRQREEDAIKAEAENAAAEAIRKQQGDAYQKQLSLGGYPILCAMSLTDSSIKELFESDVASGKIPGDWNCSNANKLLKQVNKTYENDSDTLNRTAKELYAIIPQEMKGYLKKNKGKTRLAEVIKDFG